jgi:hypothetical protein
MFVLLATSCSFDMWSCFCSVSTCTHSPLAGPQGATTYAQHPHCCCDTNRWLPAANLRVLVQLAQEGLSTLVLANLRQQQPVAHSPCIRHRTHFDKKTVAERLSQSWPEVGESACWWHEMLPKLTLCKQQCACMLLEKVDCRAHSLLCVITFGWCAASPVQTQRPLPWGRTALPACCGPP